MPDLTFATPGGSNTQLPGPCCCGKSKRQKFADKLKGRKLRYEQSRDSGGRFASGDGKGKDKQKPAHKTKVDTRTAEQIKRAVEEDRRKHQYSRLASLFSRLRYDQKHAPEGGSDAQGKHFLGGQFTPSDAADSGVDDDENEDGPDDAALLNTAHQAFTAYSRHFAELADAMKHSSAQVDDVCDYAKGMENELADLCAHVQGEKPDYKLDFARDGGKHRYAACNWVTIGGKQADGTRKGGAKICIGKGGSIEKGPAKFVGGSIKGGKLSVGSEHDTRGKRKEAADSRDRADYDRRKQAKQAGLDPADVAREVESLRDSDKAAKEPLHALYREAKRLLGVSSRNKAFATGGDVDTLQKQGYQFDDVAQTLAADPQYQGVIDQDDAAAFIFDLIHQGPPKLKTDDELWSEAVEAGREYAGSYKPSGFTRAADDPDRFGRLGRLWRKLRYAKQSDSEGQWVTIGGSHDPQTGEKHVGGSRVKIDGKGRIVSHQSTKLHGKTIGEIDKDVAGTAADERKVPGPAAAVMVTPAEQSKAASAGAWIRDVTPDGYGPTEATTESKSYSPMDYHQAIDEQRLRSSIREGEMILRGKLPPVKRAMIERSIANSKAKLGAMTAGQPKRPLSPSETDTVVPDKPIPKNPKAYDAPKPGLFEGMANRPRVQFPAPGKPSTQADEPFSLSGAPPRPEMRIDNDPTKQSKLFAGTDWKPGQAELFDPDKLPGPKTDDSGQSRLTEPVKPARLSEDAGNGPAKAEGGKMTAETMGPAAKEAQRLRDQVAAFDVERVTKEINDLYRMESNPRAAAEMRLAGIKRELEKAEVAEKAEKLRGGKPAQKVHISGNTFKHKDWLKSKGFKWNSDLKTWEGSEDLLVGTSLPSGLQIDSSQAAMYRSWSEDPDSPY